MGLSKSAENTLLIYANDCKYYGKNYHFRSLRQTLDAKDRVYGVKRSLSTLNRENRRFREGGYILKWKRRGKLGSQGERFASSITHLTWRAVYYLVRRKLLPSSFIRVWERISKKVQAGGPMKEQIQTMEGRRISAKEWENIILGLLAARGDDSGGKSPP